MTTTIKAFNAYDVDLIRRNGSLYLLIAPGGRMCEVDRLEAQEILADLIRAVKWSGKTVSQFMDGLFAYKRNIMISTIY